VLSHYRSELVERIRANGHVLSADGLTVKLAREFGFLLWRRTRHRPRLRRAPRLSDRRIFLLGEIIHNPEVNDQIRRLGIVTIAASPRTRKSTVEARGHRHHSRIRDGGCTRKKLEEKGCLFVDTTCGDVMSVMERVRQYSKDTVTSIIHGKAWHEKPRQRVPRPAPTATAIIWWFSHWPRPIRLQLHINGGNKAEFLEKFRTACSRDLILTFTCRPSASPTRPRCCAAETEGFSGA